MNISSHSGRGTMIKRLIPCFVGLIALAVLFVSSPVAATPIQDQFFDPGPSPSLATGRLDKAQTFTVGITGTLTRVDVDISRGSTADLLFDIRPTVAGVPVESDGITLAAVTVPASNIPTTRGFFSVDINSFGVSVTAGEILAIVLRSDLDQVLDYTWYGHTIDGYALGHHFFRHPPGWPRPTWWSDVAGSDLGFKTFVEPVPVPSTLLLLGSGMIGVIGLMKKKSFRESGLGQG